MSFLNRDMIKYIAMFTMLLNHVAVVFLTPGTPIYEIFVAVGYFTAITMCYFLVEGYRYTHSRKVYAGRLFLFAVISEIPYCLAFTKRAIIKFYGLNMMFTLFLCFLLIWLMDTQKNEIVRVGGMLIIIFVSGKCDWAVLAPIFTILFVMAGSSKEKIKKAYLFSIGLFGGMNFLGGMERFSVARNLIYSVLGVVGIVLSGICIVYLYNGKRMQRGRTFSKWFFYLFYPVHLLVLGILRIVIGV